MTNFIGEYMDYIILGAVVIFMLGFWIGGLVTKLAIKLRMAQLMMAITQADLENALNAPLSHEEAYELKCEESDGVLYFYEAATDKFICQGKTLDEASKNYLAAGNRRTASFIHNDTTLYFKYEQ